MFRSLPPRTFHLLCLSLTIPIPLVNQEKVCKIATLEFFLGGLVSAHLLASDSSKKLIQGSYKNQLLGLAEDLGIRFLPAFNTPYAWINLKG
ncbi:Alpha-mannosidase I mns5 [Trifolium repens]|nr:Alpha-mannosidase I mns5 [Trifolium repens]